MSDLAPAGPAQELHLADRERREVVVQHEPLVALAVDQLHLLLVVGGPEGRGHQGLGLAACEDGRPVRSGQHSDLGPDRPHLVEAPPVEPLAPIEHLVPQDALLELAEDPLGVIPRRAVLGQGRDDAREHAVDLRVVLELVRNPHRLAQGFEEPFLDRLSDAGVDRGRLDCDLRLADRDRHLADRGHDAPYRGVPRLEGLEHVVLGDLARSRLHHDDRIVAPGHHQVEHALLALGVGRVDHRLAVDQPDAHGGDRPRERNRRDRKRGRGAGQGQHVRIVLVIGRQQQGDDLRLAGPSGREQRPDRPVDQAARQHLLLGRLALALEEATRDPSGGVGVLAVVDGERKEVDALAGARRRARRDDDHRVAVAHRDGAVRLLGQLARIDGERPSADLYLGRVHVSAPVGVRAVMAPNEMSAGGEGG